MKKIMRTHKKIITQKEKTCRHGLVAVAAGLVSLAGFAAFPSDGTYAVLTKPDYNADSLYADTLSGDAKTAVTSDADYGKGFYGSSLTASSKVNRWTLYRNGAADATATGFFPPNASYDYWVSGKDLPLATPNEERATERYTFPGKSLTLSSGTITHCSKGTSVVDLGTDVRVVGTGNQYSFAARSSADPQTVGTLTLAENAELLVKAGTASGARTVFGLDWTLNAPASATVTLRNDAAARVVWNGRGDGSKSAARLVLAAEGAKAASEFALYAPYAGVVEVGKGNAAWAASETATFGTLQLNAGGALKLAAGTQTVIGTLDVRAGGFLDATDADCGTARVTDTLKAAGTVRILLPSKAGFDRAILTVPTSCSLTAADFVCLDAADGAVLDFATASFADNGDGTKTLRVTDGTPAAPGLGAAMDVRETACVTSVNARVQITVRDGATLDYAPATDNGAQMPIRGEDGSTINLLERQAEWAALPLLWVDAAAGETISNLVVTYENSYTNYASVNPLQVGQTISDRDGNPFVKGWSDCRATPCDVRLWNSRYDALYNENHNVMTFCHPRRVRGGLNGHDYLSFDRPSLSFRATFADETEARDCEPLNQVLPRIFFTKTSSADAVSADVVLKPRAAILVYGSQQGGGGALLGGNANFLRGGEVGAHTKADAILKANEIGARVWVDGEAVEPTTTGLNGGWQVIAIDFGSTTNSFSGLGYGAKNNEDNGGQAYAEVLLFDRELTDAQRQQIEWHLAAKWGLTAQYKGPTGATTRAALYGTGTVNVQTDAAIAGAFSGTINLDGATLTIDGALPPPDATALDTKDMTGWFDPDAEGSLVEQDTTSTAKPKSPASRVTWLHDRRHRPRAVEGRVGARVRPGARVARLLERHDERLEGHGTGQRRQHAALPRRRERSLDRERRHEHVPDARHGAGLQVRRRPAVRGRQQRPAGCGADALQGARRAVCRLAHLPGRHGGRADQGRDAPRRRDGGRLGAGLSRSAGNPDRPAGRHVRARLLRVSPQQRASLRRGHARGRAGRDPHVEPAAGESGTRNGRSLPLLEVAGAVAERLRGAERGDAHGRRDGAGVVAPPSAADCGRCVARGRDRGRDDADVRLLGGRRGRRARPQGVRAHATHHVRNRLDGEAEQAEGGGLSAHHLRERPCADDVHAHAGQGRLAHVLPNADGHGARVDGALRRRAAHHPVRGKDGR